MTDQTSKFAPDSGSAHSPQSIRARSTIAASTPAIAVAAAAALIATFAAAWFAGLAALPAFCVALLSTTITTALCGWTWFMARGVTRWHTNRELRDLREKLTTTEFALERSCAAVVRGLERLAEARDAETGGHLTRVRTYVRLLTEGLAPLHPELTPDRIAQIESAAALHDIGKVGVPDSVLLKPGRLDASERKLMERHPLIGGDCLFEVLQLHGENPFLQLACEIVFSHHEWWDGSGYPFGLAGGTIPLAARIVTLADTYDALRSTRVYKRAFSHAEARDIILDRCGTQFDPSIVAVFIEREAEFEQIARELIPDTAAV